MSHKLREFFDWNGDHEKLLLIVAVALTLGACAQPSASTSGYGGSMSSGGYEDPYHYRCIGMCLRGAGG